MELQVNGQHLQVDAGEHQLLVEVLRNNLGLTGTHVGCDTSQCGACVVLVDGKSVKACTVLAASVVGKEITTIEGLASPGEKLHPVQEAFQEEHGLQCGFCTPGMIITGVELLSHTPKPSDADIRHAYEGNFCRCTGYVNIVKSVQRAAS